ncbi:MAG: ATP-dependent DNA ligase [Actinobacteria bacterium]|nr:ATP-dependent DNA ligase [Actinomycetota bacterium]
MRIRAGRRTVEVGNAGKVFFPDGGITKGELVEYYARIAPRMVPLVRDRPLAMKRYPNGTLGKSFFQKDASAHFPPWIRTAEVPKRGGSNDQVLANDGATLVYLAGQGMIEPHVFPSRVDRLRFPDRLIFDMDPPDGFELARRGAGVTREVLEELGLVSFLMTTGSRGLHVVVPLKREDDFDSVGDFSRRVAEVVVSRDPGRFTIEARKIERRGRMLVDFWRNAYAQHAIAPYGVRARPGAPVATPIGWDELDDRALRADRYTIRDVEAKLDRDGDPWKGMTRRARSLEVPKRRLARLEGNG